MISFVLVVTGAQNVILQATWEKRLMREDYVKNVN